MLRRLRITIAESSDWKCNWRCGVRFFSTKQLHLLILCTFQDSAKWVSANRVRANRDWTVTELCNIKKWVTEQTAEGVASGVAYHLCQRVLLVTSLQCELVQGYGTEMSIALTAAGRERALVNDMPADDAPKVKCICWCYENRQIFCVQVDVYEISSKVRTEQ